jgi:hypothetical protein
MVNNPSNHTAATTRVVVSLSKHVPESAPKSAYRLSPSFGNTSNNKNTGLAKISVRAACRSASYITDLHGDGLRRNG